MAKRSEGSLLVHGASELLTLAGPSGPRTGAAMADLGVVREGAVYAEAGIIREVGPTAEIRRRHPRPDEEIDAQGKVVMPGFVDPHTHLLFAGSREKEMELKLQGLSYQDIAQRGGGILSTVEATRRASEGELLVLGRQRLHRMFSLGVTTAEVKSGYGLRTEEEAKILRVAEALGAEGPVDVVPTFLGAHAVPPEFLGRRGEYLQYILDDMLPAIGPRHARFCDVFVDQGFFTPNEARILLTRASQIGLKPKVHADELTSSGGAELAAGVGAVSADHLLHASDRGLKAMGERGTLAVLLPGTPLTSPNLPFADARRIITAGVPVALGTDLNPNAWVESMQLVVALACHRMGMLPSEAITASTLNAAWAAGVGERVGSLEPGKRADLLVLDVENYAQIPYRVGGNLVTIVVKGGATPLRSG